MEHMHFLVGGQACVLQIEESKYIINTINGKKEEEWKEEKERNKQTLHAQGNILYTQKTTSPA